MDFFLKYSLFFTPNIPCVILGKFGFIYTKQMCWFFLRYSLENSFVVSMFYLKLWFLPCTYPPLKSKLCSLFVMVDACTLAASVARASCRSRENILWLSATSLNILRSARGLNLVGSFDLGMLAVVWNINYFVNVFLDNEMVIYNKVNVMKWNSNTALRIPIPSHYTRPTSYVHNSYHVTSLGSESTSENYSEAGRSFIWQIIHPHHSSSSFILIFYPHHSSSSFILITRIILLATWRVVINVIMSRIYFTFKITIILLLDSLQTVDNVFPYSK